MEKKIIYSLIVGILILTPVAKAGYTADEANLIKENVVRVVKAAEKPTPGERVQSVWVTAYTSTPEETDDTPFITAAMTNVRDGIVAANFLPFGTKIKIPKLFGEKIFTVEDRMHERKSNFVDIWMDSKNEAKEFGISKTEIVILAE